MPRVIYTIRVAKIGCGSTKAREIRRSKSPHKTLIMQGVYKTCLFLTDVSVMIAPRNS